MTEAGLDDVFADDIIVPAADRYPLGATLFLPRSGKRSHAVLINSGTAVPRKLYHGFAAYLEYGNTFGRVVGAGVPIPILDNRETIKAVVDLRPQIREFDVNGWTKDGIPTLDTVRRLGIDFPEVLDVLQAHGVM